MNGLAQHASALLNPVASEGFDRYKIDYSETPCQIIRFGNPSYFPLAIKRQAR
jgi:hypothetical protein